MEQYIPNLSELKDIVDLRFAILFFISFAFQKAFNIVANKPPTLVKSIDDQFVDLNGMGFDLNLATIFEDPDGDPLTYSLVEGKRRFSRDGSPPST